MASRKPARGVSPSRGTPALVDSLMRLGFSSYEAKVYIGLLRLGPGTAYQIEQGTGVPRPNIYSALKSLQRKQAVQPVSERPTRYVALAPEEVFRGIAEETSNRCDDVAAQLASLQPPETVQHVLTVSGRERVIATSATMIAEARSRIWVKASADFLDSHLPALREAAGRGVAIVIILFGDDPSRFRLGPGTDVYLQMGQGERLGIADHLFTIVVDDDSMLTANVIGGCYGVHTRSRPVVTLAEMLIRRDIYLAEIFTRFRPELDEAFGPYLAGLRRRYFSGDQLARFEEFLKRKLV